MSEPPIQPVLHEIDFRLSYGDCDPAGIVYFAAYYPWFERTYNEWAFLSGFPPGRMAELWGATHVSVASSRRYHVPARLHDPLTCRMRPTRIGNTSFSIGLSIVHRDKSVTMAEGAMASSSSGASSTATSRPAPLRYRRGCAMRSPRPAAPFDGPRRR